MRLRPSGNRAEAVRRGCATSVSGVRGQRQWMPFCCVGTAAAKAGDPSRFLAEDESSVLVPPCSVLKFGAPIELKLVSAETVEKERPKFGYERVRFIR